VKKVHRPGREQQPELFKYDRQEPTEREIIKALETANPTLFPSKQSMKQQEIDKAYFSARS